MIGHGDMHYAHSFRRAVRENQNPVISQFLFCGVNQPVALAKALQPNKPCRGRPAPSHLGLSDSNMSIDCPVATLWVHQEASSESHRLHCL